MMDRGRLGARRDDFEPCIWVDPPIEVTVFPERIWPPDALRWGNRVRLWHSARGLQVAEHIPGRLEELVISSTGSVLGRIVFAPKLGEHRISENMLLPRTAWTPVDKRAEARLETLKRRAGFTYSDE